MVVGFSYNGIHSTVFGCYYIPDENDLFDNKADYTVFDDDSGWRDGGYYYGTKIKPREFSIDCFYEDIPKEKKERMMSWLDRKTSGVLVFDERPDVEYHVRPTKKLNGKLYTHRHEGSIADTYSGTFTITFTAYDPFGYLTKKSYTSIDMNGMSSYCGIIEDSQMPAKPTASSRDFLIYNCGTESCGCVIRIGGSAPNGLTITNDANNQKCKLLALPPSPGYLEIDSSMGLIKVKTTTGSEDIIAFEYSDEGYVNLEPCGFIYDEAIFHYTKNQNTMSIVDDRVLDNSHIGKYVYLAGGWHRIIGFTNAGTIAINDTFASSGVESSRIVTMNNIHIRGTGLTLNKLEIDYTPRVQ